MFFFFKQKTAYEMRISDWSSDVCSSDLLHNRLGLAILAVLDSGVGIGLIITLTRQSPIGSQQAIQIKLHGSIECRIGHVIADGAAPVFGRRIVRQFQPVPTSNTAPVLHGIADGGGPIIPGLTNTPNCTTLLIHCLANEREPFAILLDRKSKRLNSSH